MVYIHIPTRTSATARRWENSFMKTINLTCLEKDTTRTSPGLLLTLGRRRRRMTPFWSINNATIFQRIMTTHARCCYNICARACSKSITQNYRKAHRYSYDTGADLQYRTSDQGYPGRGARACIDFVFFIRRRNNISPNTATPINR